MKKLCEMVELVANNKNCAVLKIKPNCRMDLIALGCFNGDEELIRITKWDVTEVTIFYKGGRQFSYWWEPYQYMQVPSIIRKQKELIRECFILDLGLVCEYTKQTSVPWEDLVASSLECDELKRDIVVVPYGGNDCNILVNEQVMVASIDVACIEKWFYDRGYVVSFETPLVDKIENRVACVSCQPIVN